MSPKHVIYFLILLSIYSAEASGQDTTLLLWPAGKQPNYKPSGEQEKAEITDTRRISLVQQPDIAVFLPEKRGATGQAVVICPGGGYRILAYDWEGTAIARWLTSKGIAAIVLKYRLPNARSNITPHLSPLMDAKRAIRLVRAHAARWNINPGRVGVMGFSAGGHLAATLGTHFSDPDPVITDSVDRLPARPDFMILMYPVITLSQPFMHAGSRNSLLGENPGAELARFYSAEYGVKKDTPPTFLVHASDDNGVPVANSLVFYQALITAGVSAEMHIYPKGGHGFGLAVGRGYLHTWTDRLADWLKGGF